MRRIIYEVPRWHLLFHREARDLASATDSDRPQKQFEDELFDLLRGGRSPPDEKRNSALRDWAEKVHGACEQLPAFGRSCRNARAAPRPRQPPWKP